MTKNTSVSLEEAGTRSEHLRELLIEGERSGFAEYDYDQLIVELDS